MDIFNHLAYNTTGEEVDKAFSRCDYCRYHPHSCIFHFMLAKVHDEKYIHAAWCRNKPKEEDDDNEKKMNKQSSRCLFILGDISDQVLSFILFDMLGQADGEAGGCYQHSGF